MSIFPFEPITPGAMTAVPEEFISSFLAEPLQKLEGCYWVSMQIDFYLST